MAKNPKTWMVWICLLGTILSSALAGQKEVVRNGRTPSLVDGRRTVVTLKHDLTLGEDQDNPDTSFSILNYFAVDEEGSIFVMDQKEYKVKIFASSGAFQKAFGRKGQGPGELESPADIGFDPAGDIYIHEFFGRRLQSYNRDGQWLRNVTFPSLDLMDIQLDSRGYGYAQNVIRDAEKTIFELTKLDAKTRPLAMLASIEWPRIKSRNMASFGWPRLYFCVNKRDELIWAESTDYAIHMLDAEGKPVRDIVREGPRLEVTGAAKEEYVRAEEELYRKSSIAFPKRTYEFPKYYPAMQALLVDDAGRIYVRTYEKNQAGEIIYDVFHGTGTFVARFALPEREEATLVKKDRLYAIIRDRLTGEHLLKRYAMNWRTEAVSR
jgi:hypothetical protein